MYAHDFVGQEELIKSRIIQRLNVPEVKINNTKISADGKTITFTFSTSRDCEIFGRCLTNYSSFKLAVQTAAPVSQTIALRYDDDFKSALGLSDLVPPR